MQLSNNRGGVHSRCGVSIQLLARRLTVHARADRNLSLEAERRVVRGDDPAGGELLVDEVLGPRGWAAGHGTLRNLAVDTVAEELVRAASEVASDDVLAGNLQKLGLESLGVLAEAGRVLSHEVGHDTRVLRGGHRGTGQEVDDVVASVPGAENLLARCEDVNALTDVGEGRNLVLDVDGADGDNVRVGTTKVGGGGTASIGAVVSSSNGDVDASVNGRENGLVNRVGKSLQTPRHAHDGTDEARFALALLVVVEDPVHSGDGVGRGSGSIVTKDLDGDDVCVLGNAELGSGSGTGNVGAVTITISSSRCEGETLGGASTKDGVRDTDTGVDNVDINTSTEVGVFEGVGEVLAGWVTRGTSSVGGTLQAPRCTGLLSHERLDLGGLVDHLDFGEVAEELDALGGSVHDNRAPLGVIHDIENTVVVSMPSNLVKQRLGLRNLVLVEHDNDLLRVGGVVGAGGILGKTNQAILNLLGGGEGFHILGGRGSNGIGEGDRKGGDSKGSPHVGLGGQREKESGSAGYGCRKCRRERKVWLS